MTDRQQSGIAVAKSSTKINIENSVIRKICITVTLLLCTNGANAVVIGDKDWLQVTSTTNNSWNDFDAIFHTTTGTCDVGGCLLGGTTDLTGYIWANSAEVNSLLSSYHGSAGFPDTPTDSAIAVGPGSLDLFSTDFNATFVGTTVIRTTGWTRDTWVAARGTWIETSTF